MKTDIWMPIYIKDYLADTAHLNAEESGIYLHLIFHYWMKGKPKKNLSVLSRLCKTENIEAINFVLSEFFQEKDGEYFHKRIDIELAKATKNREIARENGKKGGRPKKEIYNQTDNPEKTDGFLKYNPEKTSSPAPAYIKSIEQNKFCKPTQKEIEKYMSEYILEKSIQVDVVKESETFFNHYESNGWKVGGRAAMKDWKASIRNWINNSSKYTIKKEKTEEEKRREYWEELKRQ